MCGRCSRSGRESPRLQVRRVIHSRRQHLSRRRINRTRRLDPRRSGRSLRQSDRQWGSQARCRPEKHRHEQRPSRSSGQDFWRRGLHPRHASRWHGARPRRAAAEPRCDDRHDRRNSHSSRRKGRDRVVRSGNFLAIVGDDETAVEAAGLAAISHVTWRECGSPNADPAGSQLAVAAAGGRPGLRRGAGRAGRPRAL